MEKIKRIYISLPISGYDIDERKDTAMEMEIKLRARGYFVCNPLGDKWTPNLTTFEYMRHDIEMLLTCDTIIMMNGWNKSAGCHTELCIATACGLNVLFETTNKMEL